MSKLTSDRNAVGSVVDSVAHMEKEIREAHVQAQTLVTTLRELQMGASSDVSNVVGLVERIRTTGEEAEKLGALVVGYQGKFEAFQAELESRNQAFQEHERTATTVNKLESKWRTERFNIAVSARPTIRIVRPRAGRSSDAARGGS